MKNLLKDYWSSMFFVKFKEELRTKPEDNECMERVVGWDYSPRLSIVHGVDDPFHQEHPQKGSLSESALAEMVFHNPKEIS